MITGAAGALGRELVAALAGEDVQALSHTALEVTDRRAVLDCLDSLRPDVVVHQAAWTDVDGCEREPDRAFRVNALGSLNVADASSHQGAHLLYLSSDLVFDGHKDGAYHEWDRTGPLQVYGRSKLAGEHACPPGSTIVRTSWLCGRRGRNMVRSVLALASEHETFGFVADQLGCPTMVGDLAGMIRHLIGERLPGIFHVTNQGEASRYELARAVMELAGHDPDRVHPIELAAYESAVASRPVNARLDNMALRLSGIGLLPPWRESLAHLVGELLGMREG